MLCFAIWFCGNGVGSGSGVVQGAAHFRVFGGQCNDRVVGLRVSRLV